MLWFSLFLDRYLLICEHVIKTLIKYVHYLKSVYIKSLVSNISIVQSTEYVVSCLNVDVLVDEGESQSETLLEIRNLEEKSWKPGECISCQGLHSY